MKSNITISLQLFFSRRSEDPAIFIGSEPAIVIWYATGNGFSACFFCPWCNEQCWHLNQLNNMGHSHFQLDIFIWTMSIFLILDINEIFGSTNNLFLKCRKECKKFYLNRRRNIGRVGKKIQGVLWQVFEKHCAVIDLVG